MTLGVWALVAAAAVGWGLRVFVQAQPVPAGTPVADASPMLQADLTRLLGADPAQAAAAPEAAAPSPDARFRLVGVVAAKGAAGTARNQREGVALIAVGDRPPRAFRVGSLVEGDTVLQAISARGAELGPRGGPVRATLQMPALPPPATGVLPPAGVTLPSPPPSAPPPADEPGLRPPAPPLRSPSPALM